MANAQGRITIRRRPKDGQDGSDAVNYRFIPSSSSIVLQKDGTLRPSALSARLVKNEGGHDVDMIAQAFNGYTVVCHINKTNGGTSSGYTPGTSLNLTNHASTLLSVGFELLRDSKVVTSVSVPCIPSGIDGEDAYVLDLDNEMEGIPCNTSGTPTGTGTLATTNATVYKGSKVDTGWTFSKEDTDCTSSINASTGAVSVTAISADRASVKVKATKGTQTLTATMSLYKVKPGSNGTSPVVYSIDVSASSISRDKYGNITPTSITAYKVKTVGNTSARTTEMVLKYLREGQDLSETALSGQGGEIKDIATSCTAVIVTLYAANGTTILDKERIPIVKDGADGKPGEDAYILDLDNEMQGIPCDSSGTPTISGTLATTNATVYKGSKVDTGWTFSKEDTDCTSSINASTGAVSVTAISADRASVKVNATKGTQTLTAVILLYKVKAGANGSSPVVYSIEVSASSISRNKDGVLNPTSITAYKNKTLGNNTTHTTEKVLFYQRVGQDASPMEAYGAASVLIQNLAASCTSVDLKLYDSDRTTILDSERIPVVRDGSDGKDGEDGEDAVRYWLVVSPEKISKNKSGVLTPDKFSCKAMYQSGEKAANETTSVFVRYRFTFINNLISNWVKYNFGAEVTVSSSVKYVTIELYKGQAANVGSDATGSGTCLDSKTVLVVSDGQDGSTGSQGIQGCIYRRTKFAEGIEYHNDEALVTDGLRYIDLVYIMKDSTMLASHALWFRCKKTHVSNSANAPQITNTGEEAWLEYWEPMNELAPLYTPFLLADNAVITLLQSNQIVVMKEDGSTVNAALGGGKYPFWIGDANPLSGKFYIDDEGRVLSGIAGGQRIEIQPDNKVIKIFDSSGIESSSFEGNSYTSLYSLFGDQSGSFTMNDKKKGSVSLTGTNPAPINEEYKVSAAVISQAPIEVVVSGFLQTYCAKSSSGDLSAPDVIVDGSSSSGPGQVQNGVVSNISTNHSNASISLYINTYSDSGMTNLLSSVLIASCRGDSSKTISSARAKTSAGGYHVLVVKVALSAVGSAQSAWAKWGSSVSGKADISGTYTSDFYVSRYFSNGFCLGRSRSNYIWAYNQSSGGMRFIMENSGYGFDISDTGIKYKHHSGNWLNMPMLVFRGRAYSYTSGSNTIYSWTSSSCSSYNSSYPTLSRVAEGQIKVTFPDSWINAGIKPDTTMINVVGFGQVNGSSDNPVKAQIYELGTNYVTISLSDDSSENDGSFIIQIYTT